MSNLNRRIISIMKYLLNSSQPISSEILASILGTTSKTIRADIETIDLILSSVGAKVSSKSGSGYLIEVVDKNEFNIFLDRFNEKYNHSASPPVYNEERIRYIMHYLLVSEDYIKSEVFLDNLYISRTTLTQDLRYVRGILADYHLSLKQKPNHGLAVDGEEQHLRIALINYLFLDEELAAAEFMPMVLKLDTKGCLDVMQYTLMKSKIHVSYQSLRELADLISVSEYRRRHHHFVLFNELQLEELMNLEEYSIASWIYSELNIDTTQSEIAYLALYIASRRIYEINDEFSLQENKSLFFLCDEVLKFLFIYTDINFLLDEDVRLLMSREFRGLLLRINYKIENRGLPVMELKAMSPIFDYALLAADYLNKKYNYKISEQEIAQLTLLFQHSIFKDNLFYPKQRVCLVFHHGKLSSYSIDHSLRKNLGEYIETIKFCEFHELTRAIDQEYDLIITDMPRINFNCSIPVYQVLNDFNSDDILKVKRFLLHLEDEYALFMQGFHDNLVLCELNFSTKEEVIKYLCQQITEKHHVSNALYQAVLAEESISSGERGNNVAIMHSLFPVCEQTTIAVGILKKPILWQNEMVQLIFVIAIGSNENYVFMSSSLIHLLTSNIFAIHELLKIKSLDQLKKIIYQYLVLERS
ncbi:BglG family transcription antiterminator [Dielma fastidiosa]|uniref:PTS sugar transporter subunit IIA n=1 Tax=Dielma fastidiosa TaxID=1034346 RepID=A0AB35UKX0_9FIRM|nr:PTS sugar transporter subunit IIA [Dielma fastidiosa]MDY5168630.1 PTS sugar transporter subunit IIA [Dielma fastidiosa]